MSKRSLDKRVGTRSGVYYNRTIRRVRRTRKYQEEGIGVKGDMENEKRKSCKRCLLRILANDIGHKYKCSITGVPIRNEDIDSNGGCSEFEDKVFIAGVN